MDEQHRENVRAANKRRGSQYCRGCGGGGVDGALCDGLPGIKYRQCGGCGW